jgi:hypothetical protein
MNPLLAPHVTCDQAETKSAIARPCLIAGADAQVLARISPKEILVTHLRRRTVSIASKWFGDSTLPSAINPRHDFFVVARSGHGFRA